MGLFHRRYLCIFAFLFLFFSFIATFMLGALKLTIAILLLALATVGAFLAAIIKKHRFTFLVGFFCLLFSGIAILNSYIFISRPAEQAAKYIGESSVEVEILACERSYDDYSEYSVRIKQIGEDKVNLKAYLCCEFASELSCNDRMIAFAKISRDSYYQTKDSSYLLTLTVDGEHPVLYKNVDTNYFSPDGFRAACNGLRQKFVNYIDSIFGGEIARLVKGLLINEKSGLSDKTISEFRRAGVSHLLAVSGVHVSLLLGALELLLKKLLVPKKIRCVVVGIFGIIFLALTGFAPSAVRAVLMLFAVYLSFMLYEDGDAITSLFVAAFIITLFSPYSVYSLGMWMSFFATLGLVSVYPHLERRLKYRKVKRGIVNVLKRFAIGVLKLALITVVANFFLLPIVWYFFGEISLVAIPSNLALSPITTVILPLSAISLALGWIPFLGEALVWMTSLLGNAMTSLIRVFANLNGAVISLNFPFVPILVTTFGIAMTVMLVIKFRRKLLICIPPIAFVLAFSICFAVFFLRAPTSINKLEGNNKTQFITVDKCGSMAVCDISDGSTKTRQLLTNNLSPYAVEIEHYVIANVTEKHPKNLKRILSYTYVRNLYLPLVTDATELSYVEELYNIAKEYGINVVFYASGERSITHYGVTLTPHFDEHSAWINIEK